MLLLKKNTFTVETDSPVVGAGEAAAIAKADEVIRAAEEEAAKIRDDAEKEYAAERVRGREEGLAAGRQEILMQKMKLVDESLKYMSSIEEKVTELVLKALSKCVAEIGDRELVVQIVHKAMQAVVRTQQELTIRTAPEMVDVVRERIKDILAGYPTVAKADVVGDERYSGAACAVETESGIVEASIEGQLAAIEKSLRKCTGEGI